MGGREGREPGGNQESGGWQARGFSGGGLGACWRRQGSEIDSLMAAELWEYAESPWVVQFR